MVFNWEKYMKLGIIHFMIYPETMKGEGPIIETLGKILSDEFFMAVEITRIKDDNVREQAKKMLARLKVEKIKTSLDRLIVGLKCGSSDTFSGLITNPTVGLTVDKLLDHGANVVFGEITEMLGAEYLIAKRICNNEVRQRFLKATVEIEKAAVRMGMDMREGQPTRGNIKGGLTTIEEKSLGAISKSGSKEINGFIEYGDQIKNTGLFILDSPGREPEILTGLVAAGAQVIIFSTGMGAPQGHPIAPVIKVTANPRTNKYLENHIDMFFTFHLDQKAKGMDAGAHQLSELLLEVCAGFQTKAEINDYAKFIDIYTKGPVL